MLSHSNFFLPNISCKCSTHLCARLAILRFCLQFASSTNQNTTTSCCALSLFNDNYFAWNPFVTLLSWQIVMPMTSAGKSQLKSYYLIEWHIKSLIVWGYKHDYRLLPEVLEEHIKGLYGHGFHISQFEPALAKEVPCHLLQNIRSLFF